MEINDSLDRLRTTLYTFVVFHPINENNKVAAEGSHFGAGISSIRRGWWMPRSVFLRQESNHRRYLLKEKFSMHSSQIEWSSGFKSCPRDLRPLRVHHRNLIHETFVFWLFFSSKYFKVLLNNVRIECSSIKVYCYWLFLFLLTIQSWLQLKKSFPAGLHA